MWSWEESCPLSSRIAEETDGSPFATTEQSSMKESRAGERPFWLLTAPGELLDAAMPEALGLLS